PAGATTGSSGQVLPSWDQDAKKLKSGERLRKRGRLTGPAAHRQCRSPQPRTSVFVLSHPDKPRPLRSRIVSFARNETDEQPFEQTRHRGFSRTRLHLVASAWPGKDVSRNHA